MAAAHVKHTREQLVEAEKARNDTARAISDYRADVTEPAPPSVFEDLDALLTFLPTPPGSTALCSRGRTPKELLPTPTNT